MSHHSTPRRLFLSTVLVAVFSAASLPQPAQATTVGSGVQATENRSVGEFNAIALRGAIKLIVNQGAATSVQVQADDQLLPLLETVLEGQRLTIGFRRGESFRHNGSVTVTVVTPQLQALGVAGSGEVLLGAFSTPKLALSIAGSGDAMLQNLKTDELGVSISGSGDVRGSGGQAGRLNVSIAGSGDAQLGELKADEVSVRIAGSGDAVVHAEKTLRVSIAGSGDVRYSGNAAVSQSVAGSGSVRKR